MKAELREEALKAAQAIYIAAEEPVARQINELILKLIDALDEAERREEVRRQFGEERGRLLDLAAEVVEAARECASLTIGLKIPAALRVTEGGTYIVSSNEYELLVELEEALKRYDKEKG